MERTLQRADGDVADRGIELDSSEQDQRRGWARTQHAVASSGAIVLKAPAGLSRSKQNMTSWSVRHRCLMWTIEWITPDGEHVLAQSRAGNTVERAFRDSVGRQCLPTRKRKREETRSRAVQSRGQGESKPFSEETQSRPAVAMDEESTHKDEAGQAHEHFDEDVEEDTQHQSYESAMQSLLSELHFYLHSPNTAANIKRLIPVPLDAKIEDILQDRLLLEFPTIFILRESPENLRPPFISDEEYTQKHGHEALNLVPGETENTHLQEHDVQSTQLDEKKVLEVLQKDLVT